jgi:hypothetical protein
MISLRLGPSEDSRLAETPDNLGMVSAVYLACQYSTVVEMLDNLVYDRNLLGLYDDRRMGETLDSMGYDCGLLGLYDHSRKAEKPENFRHFILVWCQLKKFGENIVVK